MIATATKPTNHACLNGRRCQPGAQPNTTEAPNTLCEPCQHRAARNIDRLPYQHLRLHAMIGDHIANINPRRTQPESAVLINTAIDTLLTAIHDTTTLAAEIVADHLNADNPCRRNPSEHVYACCRLITPNLHKLLDVAAVDIMEWNRAGTHRTVTVTTGITITQTLDHLAALAHYTLGMTRSRAYRDLPCARCNSKTVGRWSGADNYDCETCGAQFPEDEIRRHDRILLERHRRGLVHA